MIIHKYQKKVFDTFQNNKQNRYLLTASTSFGKTFLVYEIIRKMEYKNILLIFPSIALLSENLEKILNDNDYLFIKEEYEIFTLSEVENLGKKNLFIFTPERYLSFLEKNFIKFDFIFIDEIYKIDNEFELDGEIIENERDTAYRLASMFASDLSCDLLLAGPYINVDKNSFYSFLSEKNIVHLDFNRYEIVNKKVFTRKKDSFISEEKNQFITLSPNATKTRSLTELVKLILFKKENVIIYCSNRGKNYGTEFYADFLCNDIKFTNEKDDYQIFLEHIQNVFSEDWIVYKALKNGIGIHHGLVPKYIQKEIINFFNKGYISILVSTTTITEGVNTTAKNLIVMQNKKGDKPLLPFDAKNIAGRAGRLGFHYSGNVFDLSKDFEKVLNDESLPVKHKNYDKEVDKNDIDVLFSDDNYLTENDKIKKQNIYEMQKERQIPSEVLSMYKMISWKDKITIFDSIKQLSSEKRNKLEEFIEHNYRHFRFWNFEAVQIIIDILKPIVKSQNLFGLMDVKDKNDRYSLLVYYIENYLDKGLNGLIHYYSSSKKYDEAINISTKFVYHTLKYQVVKYFGTFNVIYKYIASIEKNKDFEQIHGLDRLIRYFEYNAVSDKGRRISDYGVPTKIVTYYEQDEVSKRKEILDSFDKYEKEIFDRTENLFEN